MKTSSDPLAPLGELLRANDLTGARSYIKKIFSSLDEDMKGKVLLAVYSAALEEIRVKKQLHEHNRHDPESEGSVDK